MKDDAGMRASPSPSIDLTLAVKFALPLLRRQGMMAAGGAQHVCKSHDLARQHVDLRLHIRR
jgi:hypothetical protein